MNVLFFYKRKWLSSDEHLTSNNTQHNKSTRYAGNNSICPYYKLYETERGRFFAVLATWFWNNVPLNIRRSDSVKSLKTHLCKTLFAAQQHLDHFSV